MKLVNIAHALQLNLPINHDVSTSSLKSIKTRLPTELDGLINLWNVLLDKIDKIAERIAQTASDF